MGRVRTQILQRDRNEPASSLCDDERVRSSFRVSVEDGGFLSLARFWCIWYQGPMLLRLRSLGAITGTEYTHIPFPLLVTSLMLYQFPYLSREIGATGHTYNGSYPSNAII